MGGIQRRKKGRILEIRGYQKSAKVFNNVDQNNQPESINVKHFGNFHVEETPNIFGKTKEKKCYQNSKLVALNQRKTVFEVRDV
jgi:hypothetical protein